MQGWALIWVNQVQSRCCKFTGCCVTRVPRFSECKHGLMSGYRVWELPLRNGWLGIGPMPGRNGTYQADLTAILRWGADLVLTMTTQDELDRGGVAAFGADLSEAGVEWRHLPVPDFGAPPPETAAAWPKASAVSHSVLAEGGRVFAHCYGGCGRSGMALMRLMVEAGENADDALVRLRDARTCAVETEEQKTWAAAPMFDRLKRAR